MVMENNGNALRLSCGSLAEINLQMNIYFYTLAPQYAEEG